MRVVILGAGGHGRVMAECAISAGHDVTGFLDDDPLKLNHILLGIPVLGTIQALEDKRLSCDGVLLGIGDNLVRIQVVHRFIRERLFPVMFHRRAWFSPSAMSGPGTVIMANATVQTGCRLGAAVIVNTNASVDHDCALADGVHISPGAHLAGNVTVGEGTHIGIGASVIEGIRIGAHCLIAAGAVVVRDVPDGQRVAGVPARPMKPRGQG